MKTQHFGAGHVSHIDTFGSASQQLTRSAREPEEPQKRASDPEVVVALPEIFSTEDPRTFIGQLRYATRVFNHVSLFEAVCFVLILIAAAFVEAQ